MIRIALSIMLVLAVDPAMARDRCHAIFEASRECRWPYVDGSNVRFCDRINPKEAACAAKRQAAWDAAERKTDIAKPCRDDGATFGCRTGAR